MTQKPFLNDMTCRYDGRVIALDVYVNSGEDLEEVTMRVQKAARGQVRNAVVVMAKLYEGDDGKAVWASLQEISSRAAANPKSKVVE